MRERTKLLIAFALGLVFAVVLLRSLEQNENRVILELQRQENYAAQNALYTQDPLDLGAFQRHFDRWSKFDLQWSLPNDYKRAPDFVKWRGQWVPYREWINRKSSASR